MRNVLWSKLQLLHDRIRRLPADTRGVAAIEFCMLAPLMLNPGLNGLPVWNVVFPEICHPSISECAILRLLKNEGRLYV